METDVTGSNSHSNDFTLEIRSIWVAICNMPELDGFRVWIHPSSTFSDVKQKLATMDPLNLSNAMVLQPHFGHRTYWNQPDPATRIGDTCRILYAVATGESEPYLLAVVRSPQSDYPLVISTVFISIRESLNPGVAPPNWAVTVSQAIIATQPDLGNRIQNITDYSGSLNIAENQLDFQHHTTHPCPTFPTVFLIVTNEGSFDLRSDEANGFVPPLLQTPMVHCEYLLRRASSLSQFRAQTIHLLQATRHIILSFAEALNPLFDKRYLDLEDVLSAESSLVELLPIAPLLANHLKAILNRMEIIIRSLETENVDLENIKKAIDHIFDNLCEDLPGAVAVRHSYANFERLSRVDYESLLRKYDDMGPPDDHLTISRALDIQTRILDALKDELGDDHPDTLKAVLRVASTYVALGRYSEAKNLQTNALKHMKKRSRERDYDTLTTMESMASTYNRLGAFPDAAKLGSEAVTGFKLLLGDQHPDTYRAIANLAWTYHKQARNSEAESLLTGALEGLGTTLGKGHPDTLVVARQISLVYAALGRYLEAEVLQKQAVDGIRLSLGNDHRNFHASAIELASIYYKQGRYPEARALQVDSLQRLKVKLGETHPDVFMAMRELALTCSGLGQYSEAEGIQVSALDGLKSILGVQHVEMHVAQLELASTYYYQGRYAEAAMQQLRCLNNLKTLLGEAHLLTLMAMRLVALTYYAQSTFSAATSHQAKALAGFRSLLGEMHPDTLLTNRDLAATHSALGLHSEARALQEPSVNGLEEKIGRSHPETIIAMLNLAETYSALGLHSEAEAFQARISTNLADSGVLQHAGILNSIYKLALVYQSSAAKRLARKVLRIQQNQGTQYSLINLFKRLDPAKKEVNSDTEMVGDKEGLEEGLDLDLD